MKDLLNISLGEIKGKCDLKCSYNFQYTSSSCTSTNYSSSIVISIDKTNIPPVIYNKEKYDVGTALIHYPSSILYNNNIADAELVITHIAEKNNKLLNVYIPIKVSDDSVAATDVITNVIESVSKTAPSTGGKVIISNFNLQNIVPVDPFFIFNLGNQDCIAFSMFDAIPIKSSTFDTLKKIISKNSSSITKDMVSDGLTYNSSGPNSSTVSFEDGIYISCNPTGNSKETKEVTYVKNESDYDMGAIFVDPTFIIIVQTFVACLVFIVICYVWNYGYTFIDGEFYSSQINNVKGNK